MNFKKPITKEDISSIGSKSLNKFKTDGFDEAELKQLENDSANLLNSIGPLDITMNRDLGQLKELLSKNIHDVNREKRKAREGNGRRLLASEKFNHGLVENQLLSLKQDLNIGAKVGTRKIYRVKRDNQYIEQSSSQFKTLVQKLIKRGTQYELDYIGKEDKRLSNKNMYMEICADIEDQFRKLDGKHNLDFDSFLSEDIKKSIPVLSKNLPKDLKDKEVSHSPFVKSYELSHPSKHDSNTKSLLNGYFKGVQKFLEDAIFIKNCDVTLMQEFYKFEKEFHNLDDSFQTIWAILICVFENIDIKVVEYHSENPSDLQRKLCRNTCNWFEQEFCQELGLNDLVAQYGIDPDDDYEVTEELMNAVIDRVMDFMKDTNYEVDDVKLETENETLPIYAIIYFCLRAGKRREAVKIASRSSLPEAKVITNLLKEELFYLKGNSEVPEITDNIKLHDLAFEYLANISKHEDKDNGIDSVYKKDIFKEALLTLMTKHITPAHPNLCSNLSDYLWFNIQKCYFERPGMEFKKNNKNILTLKMLQATILEYGESYFNEDGQSPLNFYKVLILIGLYEEAIRYLDAIDKHRIENTHVALALYENGIISREDQKDNMDIDITSSSLTKSRAGKKKAKDNVFITTLKNFLNFLGPEFMSISVIYASIPETDNISLLSELFVRNNSFQLLLETTTETGLDLVTKKNQPLSKFVTNATFEKIIHNV